MKTVFFGTPALAVPFLKQLVQSTQVLAVVTAPDKPAGRGYALTPPPVKTAAQELGLPVFQPEKLKGFSLPAAAEADFGIVVAYGYLIPRPVFSAPRGGLINVHFSLLPKFRGAGPMQWALIRGETQTGVSLFRIEEGMDTGPVYLQKTLPIAADDHAGTLKEKLVALGLAAQKELVEKWPLTPKPQEGEWTDAPLLKKSDGQIFWERHSAAEIMNLIRGTSEWPGAFTIWKGQRLKVKGAAAGPGGNGRPGEVLAVEKGRGFLVKCVSDSLLITRVQPEGKREMAAEDFWNGQRLKPGDRFTEEILP